MEARFRASIALILIALAVAACGRGAARDRDANATPTVETLAVVQSAERVEDTAPSSAADTPAEEVARDSAQIGAPVAQDVDCGPLLDVVRSAVDECEIIDDNWACYGHETVDTSPANPNFAREGDQSPVADFTGLMTLPGNGVAVLRLIVTATTHEIVMLSMGGSEIDPEGPQSYVLETTTEGLLCQSTPSGLTVRTEMGEPATLTVNGVEIDLASTAFLTLPEPDTMLVVNLDGGVTARAGGRAEALDTGWQIEVFDIGGEPRLADEPEPSPYAQSEVLEWLATDPSGLAIVRGPSEPADETTSGAADAVADTAPPPVPPARIPGCVVTCPDGWARYRVQPGDNLTDIAARTVFFQPGLTVDDLRATNCIAPASDVIQVNELICVPAPATPTPGPPAPTPTDSVESSCPDLSIADLSVGPLDSDESGLEISWTIEGGCDPVRVTLTRSRTGEEGTAVKTLISNEERDRKAVFPDQEASQFCPATNYLLEVTADGVLGSRTASAQYPTDCQAPEVSITAPIEGAVVSGMVTIEADASDNVGVTRVTFLVDGGQIGMDDTPPYAVEWNIGSGGGLAISDGHRLTAYADDAAGNRGESDPVSVTVDSGVPDLAPTSGDPTFCVRANGNLVVTVENKGTARAEPSMTKVDFTGKGDVTQTTQALESGESKLLYFDIPSGCFDPDCEFSITVDSEDTIDESDERNNMVGDVCAG